MQRFFIQKMNQPVNLQVIQTIIENIKKKLKTFSITFSYFLAFKETNKKNVSSLNRLKIRTTYFHK